MKDRNYFLRADLDTFKRKFKSVCREKEFEIKKYNEINYKSLADVKKVKYICITEIK